MASFASGHAGKLLGAAQVRRLGIVSLGLMLEATQLQTAVIRPC
jgi:hypothetical protein